MVKGIARNVNKKLTAEEKARHQKIREQISGEKPELMARGRAAKAEHDRLKEEASFDANEANAAQDEVARDAGWDDPAMDVYDEDP